MKTQLNLALTSVVFLVSALQAKTWEERAADRFKKPVSQSEKQKIIDSLPNAPRVVAKQPRKILLISRCEGFIHLSIPYAKIMLEQMGKKISALHELRSSRGYELESKDQSAST